MYKGDKPGDDACLIVLSVVSLYSWLFFSCPFPWPFIINSQCCFYTTLGRTAHHIPLLAQLCKEKDARVPLDGFFFFFLLALGYSYLLDYHNLIPLHAIFLPFPRSCALCLTHNSSPYRVPWLLWCQIGLSNVAPPPLNSCVRMWNLKHQEVLTKENSVLS